MKNLVLLATMLFLNSLAFSQTQQIKSEDLKSMEGKWNGTIEYFDFKKAKDDIRMQTELVCVVRKNTLIFKFIYWDENGEYIKRTEKLELLDNGTQVKDNQVWFVKSMERNQKRGQWKLSLQSENPEIVNGAPMQKIISVSRQKLSIVKNLVGGSENNKLYSLNFEKK